MAETGEKYLDAPIPIPRILARQFPHDHYNGAILSSSRSRAATILLSRPFSCSSCFRRFTSEISTVPDFMRHAHSACSLTACFFAVATRIDRFN